MQEDKRTREAEGFSTMILAAGMGTRMKSELVKVLHPLCDAPMLSYPIAAARAAGTERIVVVIGYQAERIRDLFGRDELIFVEQRELLGTGHAVLQAREVFKEYSGAVVILSGDVPLILPETVRTLYDRHRSEGAAVTVLTTILADPAGYGRIVRTDDGRILKIVEEKDATAEEKQIREINTGIYCVENRFLFTAVGSLGNRNVQREYYLTDIVEIAFNKGLRVVTSLTSDPVEVMGINTSEELEKASRRMENRNRR